MKLRQPSCVPLLLSSHGAVDLASLRVRFIRFDASAVEIEVFTYVSASDANNGFEIQEELLHGIRDVIQRAGTGVALPSLRIYFAADNPVHAVAEESETSDATGVSDSHTVRLQTNPTTKFIKFQNRLGVTVESRRLHLRV